MTLRALLHLSCNKHARLDLPTGPTVIGTTFPEHMSKPSFLTRYFKYSWFHSRSIPLSARRLNLSKYFASVLLLRSNSWCFDSQLHIIQPMQNTSLADVQSATHMVRYN